MENSLGQYCINVSDLDRSVEFWSEVIGIPVQSRTEIPTAKEVVLQAEVGGSRIQLAQQLEQDGPIDMGSAMWKLYVDTVLQADQGADLSFLVGKRGAFVPRDNH